jgi:hypothetical protein
MFSHVLILTTAPFPTCKFPQLELSFGEGLLFGPDKSKGRH